MKILFQELCSAKLDGDQELQGQVRKKGEAWVEDLSKVRGISINRCLYPNLKVEVLTVLYMGLARRPTV